ncbi:MAG: hypothetical protein KatS3mg105_5100 [Gemmatales bacterium]|nr:MAG: hypothetical protein KatS3mg105_5100 [Gemmatales bacterium]
MISNVSTDVKVWRSSRAREPWGMRRAGPSDQPRLLTPVPPSARRHQRTTRRMTSVTGRRRSPSQLMSAPPATAVHAMVPSVSGPQLPPSSQHRHLPPYIARGAEQAPVSATSPETKLNQGNRHCRRDHRFNASILCSNGLEPYPHRAAPEISDRATLSPRTSKRQRGPNRRPESINH